VLVYDHLKNGGMSNVGSFEESVDNMMEEGILQPGNLRSEYLLIYEEAGIDGVFD